MARELEGLERQIEVSVAAHERDMRVITEIGPEVHGLFFQLGCRDTQVPDEYKPTFMTDRNLMRMLGLVDQQTVLLMSLFAQLDQEMSGGAVESISTMDQQRRMQDAQALRNRASQLSRKPEPPKMGDFDEGGGNGDDDDDDDMMEEEDETSSSSSSSSSSDSEDEGMTAKERRRRTRKKEDRKRAERAARKKRVSFLARRAGPASAVQKPEPISNLRKSVQRQIETGQHRHNHSSVHRFEPTRGKEHFKKRETGQAGLNGVMGGLGISSDQLAQLQHSQAASDIVHHKTGRS
jgi:hypothetical protein